jgi:rhodanese-related sulfurtransferase
MNFKRLFLSLSLISVSVFSQNTKQSFDSMLNNLLDHSVPEITSDTLKVHLKKYLILDARELEEYTVSHLQAAKYIGYDDFDLDSLKKIKKNTPIVVYCSVGKRSEIVCEKLIKAGFTNVQNLLGGIFAWKNNNYEIYSGNKLTNKVHAFNKKWGQWLIKGEKVY